MYNRNLNQPLFSPSCTLVCISSRECWHITLSLLLLCISFLQLTCISLRPASFAIQALFQNRLSLLLDMLCPLRYCQDDPHMLFLCSFEPISLVHRFFFFLNRTTSANVSTPLIPYVLLRLSLNHPLCCFLIYI